MDSSVTGTYKEKPPPRRKTAVRKPRTKKETELSPIITSLISPVERQAIRTGQARLVAETERASATKIQQAIRNKNARKTISKLKSEKETNVPVPKNKEKKVKPVYKMSYAAAVKAWNTSRGNAMWCNPRKNSDEYKAVMAMRM